MNLWIRSQNKKELIPNPQFGIEQCEERYYIVDRYNFGNAFILGEYKSEERALEVLDEIQERVDFNIKLKVDTCIYEIPKE